MLPTSLRQWARRYHTITQPAWCSPHKRARTRAFFASGFEKFHVPWAVDALPAMVHLSLFFFAGLLVYLFNINHIVFKVMICWVALLRYTDWSRLCQLSGQTVLTIRCFPQQLGSF
jgi:hypothetical protein